MKAVVKNLTGKPCNSPACDKNERGLPKSGQRNSAACTETENQKELKLNS